MRQRAYFVNITCDLCYYFRIHVNIVESYVYNSVLSYTLAMYLRNIDIHTNGIE